MMICASFLSSSLKSEKESVLLQALQILMLSLLNAEKALATPIVSDIITNWYFYPGLI